MAKQIRGVDIIEKDHLSDAILSAKTLTKQYKQLDEQIIKTAKDLKKIVVKGTGQSAREIKELTGALSESELKKRAVLRIDKEKQKLDIQLKALNSEKIKQNDVLKRQARDQAKINKLLVELDGTRVGSLKRVRAENKLLAREKENVNRLTKSGAKRIKEINRQLDRNNAVLEKNASKLGKQKIGIGRYNKAIQGLRSSLARLGLAFGVFALFRNTFTIIKDFDQAQADLASVLGVSRESMAALTEQAKELGATTVFTASQVAELQKEFAKLGFTQREIEQVTEATLQLAAAAGVDLATAAQVTGSTLRAFGLDASETQRVVDLMSKSFSSSSLDMEKFAVAMRSVAPVAKNAGLSIERTTALLGTLTDRGIDASTAGTGLRNVFLELSKRGITFEEAMLKINSAADKNAAALELFGKRGAVVGTILAETSGDVATLEQKLLDAGGAAKEMADKQLDTLEGAVKLLKSAWEGLILEMDEGVGVGGALKDTIVFLAKNLKTIVKVVVTAIGVFIGLKIVMTAINVVTGINTALINRSIALTKKKIIVDKIQIAVTGKATIAQKLLNKAMRLFPLFLIIAGVIALVAALKKWFGSLADVNARIKEQIKVLKRERIERLLNTEAITAEQKALQKIIKQKIEENRIRRRSRRIIKEAIKIGSELLQENRKEIATAQNLLTALMDENISREERNEIIDELNRKYPELLGNIDLETASTQELLNVRRELTKEILLKAIADKKAAAQAVFFNKILDAQVGLIFATTEGVRESLRKDIKSAEKSILIIEDVTTKVLTGIDAVVDKLDFTSRLDEIIADIEKSTNELNKAIAEGQNETADRIRKRLEKLNKEKRIILGLGAQAEDDANKDSENKSKGSTKKKIKTEEQLNKQAFSDIVKNNLNNLKILELNAIKEGKDKEEIDKILSDRRLVNAQIERDGALRIFGKFSVEFLDADLKLNRALNIQSEEQNQSEIERKEQLFQDILDINEENLKRLESDLIAQGKSREEIDIILAAKRLEQLENEMDEALRIFGEGSEKFLEAKLKFQKAEQTLEEKQNAKRLKDLKKLRDESLAIFKDITDGLAKNIDKRIEQRQREINESTSEIERLKDLAAKGSIDAAESIKAEKIAIAKEKLEIEALEKRKRNLLITVVALERASQLIGSGDGNPFANAGAQLRDFLADLPKNSEGTDYNIAQTLGAPQKQGKDGYLSWVDGEEKLLSVKNSRKLSGMHQDEVTRRALAYENNVVSSKAMKQIEVQIFSDYNIVKELKANTEAINNIRIVQQHIDLKTGTEVIVDGNKITRNDHRPSTFKI